MRKKYRHQLHPIKLSSLFPQWFSRHKMESELRQYTIWQRWREIVGERLAEQTQPQSLHNGVLNVVVASSAWLNEMAFVRGELVQKLNNVLAIQAVKTVRFYIGVVRSRSHVPGPSRPICHPPVELDQDLIRQISQDTECIADDELRRKIQRARIAQCCYLQQSRPFI